MKTLPRFLLAVLTLASACLLTALAQAASPLPSITGTYDSEGSVVESESGYTGAVSLSGLLGLQLDLAAGSIEHGSVARVEIEQRDRTFTVRTKDDDNKQVWTGTWERNGGYEATKDGVKILLRHARFGEDFFMFTLTTINEGAALLVEVQRIQATKFGPVGKPFGKFLFLRASP
jgi:hypothetical protein